MMSEAKTCRWKELRALAEKACGTDKSSAAYGALLQAIDATDMLDLTALASQRDEGLAREVKLRERNLHLDKRLREEQTYISELASENTAFQQRLAEAKRLLLDVRGQLCGPDQRAIDAFLASYGCADGEEAE